MYYTTGSIIVAAYARSLFFDWHNRSEQDRMLRRHSPMKDSSAEKHSAAAGCPSSWRLGLSPTIGNATASTRSQDLVCESFVFHPEHCLIQYRVRCLVRIRIPEVLTPFGIAVADLFSGQGNLSLSVVLPPTTTRHNGTAGWPRASIRRCR